VAYAINTWLRADEVLGRMVPRLAVGAAGEAWIVPFPFRHGPKSRAWRAIRTRAGFPITVTFFIADRTTPYSLFSIRLTEAAG